MNDNNQETNNSIQVIKVNKNPEQNENLEPNTDPKPNNNIENEESVYGILAIVFGALGSFIGLIFVIIGLCTYKKRENRRNCYIGLVFVILWFVFVLFMVVFWCILYFGGYFKVVV